MARTYNASEMVPRGAEGTGEAQILTGGLQPLDYFLKARAMKGAEDDKKKEAQKKAFEQFKEYKKFKADEVWHPFQEQLDQFVYENINKPALNQLYTKGTYDDINYLANEQRAIRQMEFLRNKVDYLQDIDNNITEQLKTEGGPDGELIDDHFLEKQRKIIQDEENNFKPIQAINHQEFDGFFKDPEGFNRFNIAKHIVDDLPSTIQKTYSGFNADAENYQYNTKQIESKIISKNVEDGSFKINIVPEFIDLMKKHPRVSQILEYEKGRGVFNSDEEVLVDMFESWVSGKYLEGGGRSGRGAKQAVEFEAEQAPDDKTLLFFSDPRNRNG